jgi:hypothetical protein
LILLQPILSREYEGRKIGQYLNGRFYSPLYASANFLNKPLSYFSLSCPITDYEHTADVEGPRSIETQASKKLRELRQNDKFISDFIRAAEKSELFRYDDAARDAQLAAE